jgi:competence CoiA-like predicted nuclease
MLWAHKVEGPERLDVEAWQVAVEGDYRCPNPQCQAPVFLRARNSPVVVAHFAHAAQTSCAWSRGETPQHRAAKCDLRDALRTCGLDVRAEAVLGFLPVADNRADLLLTSAAGRKIAIEIQHTAIALEALADRTRRYQAKDIPVLWLPLLPEALRRRRREIKREAGGSWRLERFAAPHWHRWIADYQLGRLWYYDDAKRQLLECRIEPHLRFEKPRHYWNPRERDLAHDAGGFRRSRRWIDLRIVGRLPIAALDFRLKRRAAFHSGDNRLPACYVVWPRAG